jgi:hypothetical protein
VDAVEGSWTNSEDCKVRIVLGMFIHRYDHLEVLKSLS